MALSAAQTRLGTRLVLLALGLLTLRWVFGSSTPPTRSPSGEIQSHGVIDRFVGDRNLDVHKHAFLQSRLGRDDRPDMFDQQVSLGVADYWERFQRPFITGSETSHLDSQSVRQAINDLLTFNGWVAAACPTLKRPFGQNQRDDNYEDLAAHGELYYIAIVVHSADHFLVDQLAVIVQLAKILGTRNVFVSMLDSDSSDSTPTLSDLCEAVLTILGVAFRIRRVPPMTIDPTAAYYPLEEATARNLALDPLFELETKRQIKFHRVVWLKGFTCPSDVLESLRVSRTNEAALVCGMDWAEHNGFFIFSDRWRTRDIEGNLFRQAKSNAKSESGPPRDRAGTERYAVHLPFQVFCCESGSHVVDPHQSYYKGLAYRASELYQNLSTTAQLPEWDPETQCMDSTQMWFCRDLWVDAARGGLKDGRGLSGLGGGEREDRVESPEQRVRRSLVEPEGRKSERAFVKRQQEEKEKKVQEGEKDGKRQQADAEEDEDVKAAENAPPPPPKVVEQEAPPPPAVVQPPADAAAAPAPAADDNKPVFAHNNKETSNIEEDALYGGTAQDAMPEADNLAAPPPVEAEDLAEVQNIEFLVPNSAFQPAKILVNPRCVTTYGGVSHTKLALDLFGGSVSEMYDGTSAEGGEDGQYLVTDWAGAPDSHVCQEQRSTGGRVAPKSQRRVGFILQNEVGME